MKKLNFCLLMILISTSVASVELAISAHSGSGMELVVRREGVVQGGETGASMALQSPGQTLRPAFTLTMSRTVSNANAQARTLATSQRAQRSDGLYKLVQTFSGPDGATVRVDQYFGFVGLGVFRLDEARRRLVFTGPFADGPPENVEQFLRAHPLYVRDESVVGLSAIVWRKDGQMETEFTEEYRAPALDGLLVKTVAVSAGSTETIEPTSVEMGEPAQGFFAELLLHPVDYSDYERRVQEAERKDHQDVARLMRELLLRMRSRLPDGR